MLFNNKNILLFLTPNSLYLFDKKVMAKLEITPDIIKNNNIVSEEKFNEAILEFIGKTGIRKADGILMLSNDLVHEKTVPTSDPKILEKEIEDFIKGLPFDLKKISKMEFKKDKDAMIIATNGHIYECLMKVGANVNININLVFPASVFTEQIVEEDLGNETAELILSKQGELKHVNFLTKSKKIPDEGLEKSSKNDSADSLVSKEPKKESSDSTDTGFSSVPGSDRKMMPIIMVAVLVLIIMSGLLIVKFSGFNFTSSTQKSETKAVPTQELSPTPTVAPIAKDEIKIQILNGSGIVGQAKKIKDNLEAAGFTNILTGNAQENKTGNIVTFSPKVPKETRKELLNAIGKLLDNVTEEENKETLTDILITTGK
ncbi:MAG: LytR C-terminal domain-containing protein [bacterium]|nr:LytR C-terminal domain-containing protein [bacterium]